METSVTVATTLIEASLRDEASQAARQLGHRCVDFPADNDLLSAMGLYPPDVLIMQLDGDSDKSLKLHEQLRRALDPVCVIYLAVQPDVESVVRAMQFGAITVLCPPWCRDELMQVIIKAVWNHRTRAMWIGEIRQARQMITELSDRQRHVMTRIISGSTNKAVALQLNISAKTVEKHRQLLHSRTGTSTLPELVRLQLTAERPLEAAYALVPEEAATESNSFTAQPEMPQVS